MAFFERGGPLASAQTRDALNRLIDGFQTLVREHLALAKIELKEDVNRMARSLVLSAAGVPALIAGYMLLNIAIALLLATVMASWVAFGIVALVNLGAGSALTVVFGKKAKEIRLSLSETGSELRRDREMLSGLQPVAPVEPPSPTATPASAGEMRPAAPAPSSSPAPGAGAASDGASMPATASPARPLGKAGSTPGLQRRSEDPMPGQPVAGATSTPNGEPMTATRRDLAR
ncbi:MAG: phage holin family protein [Myxococcales bacterium]